MKVDFYPPKNAVLQKFIEGFYFIKEDKNSEAVNYITFPNNYCILTINRNSQVQIVNNSVTIQVSDQENIVTSLCSRYTDPMQIQYVNLVDEITIYFKPLGINHFVADTKTIFQKSSLIDFSFSAGFNAKIAQIFKLDRNQQINELENFLISMLKTCDLTFMSTVLNDLELGLSIHEIAESRNLSRQYISKIFIKNLGKTPSEYRKIHRFRQTIQLWRNTKNLSELSQFGFFDQSHLIKDFKKFTGIKPQSFFKNIDTETENIWLII